MIHCLAQCMCDYCGQGYRTGRPPKHNTQLNYLKVTTTARERRTRSLSRNLWAEESLESPHVKQFLEEKEMAEWGEKCLGI